MHFLVLLFFYCATSLLVLEVWLLAVPSSFKNQGQGSPAGDKGPKTTHHQLQE